MKKVISTLLTICLLFSMNGCGSHSIEDIIADYISGKIDYDKAYSKIDSAANKGTIENYEAEKAIDELSELQDSKSSFEAAENLFDSGLYLDAIMNYQNVIPEDSNYTVAQSKMSAAKERTISELTDKVNTFADKKQYNEALAEIRYTASIIGNISELLTLEKTLYAKCIDTAISEAETAFRSNKDYSTAINIINSAISLIGDDERLISALNKYNSYIPVLLLDMDYIKKTSYLALSTADYWQYGDLSSDVEENSYDGNIIYPVGGTLASQKATSEDDSYISFYLNSAYNTLTGTVYRPYGTLSCKDVWDGSTTIKIYGDNVLLYEAPNITQETYSPIDFEIDVSGVRELKIVMLGVWTSTEGNWIGQYSRYPKACMANLIVCK